MRIFSRGESTRSRDVNGDRNHEPRARRLHPGVAGCRDRQPLFTRCVMNLVRWDPFRELEEMSTRLNRFFGQPPARRVADEDGAFFADWAPAIDIEESEKE